MKDILNTLRFKFFALLVSVVITQIGYAQRPIVGNNTCPNPNGSRLAQLDVKFFLTWGGDSRAARIETGAINETVDQIQPVSDPTSCAALNQIVFNNTKYRNIDENLRSDRAKYYYKTNNFFYIFWSRKPEYDNRPTTGPQKLFIVVSADFQNVWEYYF